MKTSEVLKSLAAQSGIDEAKLASILPSYSSLDIDDEIANALIAPRFTLDSAKNNPDIRKHYHGELYSTFGNEIDKHIAEFSDEDKAAIKAEKLVLNRIPLLVSKIKAFEEQKAMSSVKDKGELTKKIDGLNTELLGLRTTISDMDKAILDKEKEFDGKMEAAKQDWEFNMKLSSYDYNMPEGIDSEVKVATARQVIGKKMKELGVVFKPNDKGITDVFNTDGTLYHDKNNRHLNVDDFMKQILVDAKLLNLAGKTPPRVTPASPGAPGVKKISSGFADAGNAADKWLEQLNG